MSSADKPATMRFMCCSYTFQVGKPLRIDEEGFFVCPTHGQRRYGWRSPRRRSEQAIPFDPANPKFIDRVDYTESPLERDQSVVAAFFEEHKIEGVPMTQAEHDRNEAEFKQKVDERAKELVSGQS